MESYDQLKRWISKYPSVAVAFSGGVDSTLLLRAACDVLGQENVIAITISSTLHGHNEMEDASRITKSLSVYHITKTIDPLSISEVKSNSPLRCYYCKKMIFQTIIEIAKKLGIKNVLDGTNASDLSMYRPGIRALKELAIQSPLMEGGITKTRAREILKKLGMNEADKPSNSCLATRIPYNTELQEEVLARIDYCEQLLREAGYPVCRVRVHNDLARIEVPHNQIKKLIENKPLLNSIKDRGFTYVCVDYDGYRSGCYDTLEDIGQ